MAKTYTLEEIVTALKNINSVCSTCDGKGEISLPKIYGKTRCGCCNGCGCHSGKEVLEGHICT